MNEQQTLEQRLHEIVERFPTGAAFSTSLGKEDQVITHAIAEKKLPIRIFTLDTGRLFEETQSLITATRERLEVSIEVYTPNADSLQKFLSEKGPNSFFESVENRLECCRIRKVEPLKRALVGTQVWLTGLRRAQSANRSNLPFEETDPDHNVLKIHPLLDWTDEQLDAYISNHNIPINRLHAKGFPSIGCAPCTRAVKLGEDSRAGRWWWENPNKKECGLHLHTKESH